MLNNCVLKDLRDHWSRMSLSKMSGRVEIHPNGSNASIKVGIHLDNESNESIKVEKHPKDKLISSKAEICSNENLRLRERNGATYQVPDDWEELYEAETEQVEAPKLIYVREKRKKKSKIISEKEISPKRVTELKSESKNIKEDYYTSLQKSLRADMKAADEYFHGLKTGAIKKHIDRRWNKKHLGEIERDKQELNSWFESGIVCRAFAPKQTRKDPNSDGIDPNACAFMELPKCKPLTLGDYIPSFNTKKSYADICKDKTVSKEEDKLPEPFIDGDSDYEIFEPRQSENYILPEVPSDGMSDKSTQTDEEIIGNRFQSKNEIICQSEVPPCPDNIHEPYQASCEISINSIDLEKLMKKVIETSMKEVLMSDDSDGLIIGSNKLNIEPSKLENSITDVVKLAVEAFLKHVNEDLHKRNSDITDTREKILLCLHGVEYHVKCFSDSVFLDAEHTLELVPQKRLNGFAEAIRVLIKSVEDLIISCKDNPKYYDCQAQFCRWNSVLSATRNINRSAKNTYYKPINDLISFEVKLTEVNSPKFGLKTLLSEIYELDNISRNYERLLSLKYKKALDALETAKYNGFDRQMDKFACFVYGQMATMLELLLDEEAHSLRQILHNFYGALWQLRDSHSEENQRKSLCCANIFRSKGVEESQNEPDESSEFIVNRLLDNPQLSIQSLSSQLRVFGIGSNVAETAIEQHCPTIKVEHVSPESTFQYGENNSETQDSDSAKKEGELTTSANLSALREKLEKEEEYVIIT